MDWIDVKDRLPNVGADGYSEPVLVYFGKRLLPEVARYSPYETTFLGGIKKRTRSHWWSTATYPDSDRNGPLLEPTHWCKIVYPD